MPKHRPFVGDYPVAVPDFVSAAARHYRDARTLADLGRHPSADHLAGFAAECSLKAILLGFLGGYLNPKGKPVTQLAGTQQEHGHLPGLCTQVATAAAGRSGPAFLTLMISPNPFDRWQISDRYEDGSSIGEARVRHHLAAAAEIINVHQQANMGRY